MIGDLDFRSHVPIYSQIADQIKRLVATGELKPDDQLPTVRQLASELRINFNTVARAYRMLDEEGVISTQQGRGTYVLETVLPQDAELARRNTLSNLVQNYLLNAERLGFEPGEIQAMTIKRLDAWQKSGSVPDDDVTPD
jgi:GntR family transcriptional regulator